MERERDWSDVLDDIHYLSKRLSEEGDPRFRWRVGEIYKDEHTIDLDYLGVRAVTKQRFNGDKIYITCEIGRELIHEPLSISLINKDVIEEFEYVLAQ